MTITIHPIIIYYWLFAIVFESIYNYVSFSKALKKVKGAQHQYEYMKLLIKGVKDSLSANFFWKYFFGPGGYLLAFMIICVIAPILFPFSLFFLFKRAIGYKPKSKDLKEPECEILEAGTPYEEVWKFEENPVTDQKEPIIKQE